MPETAEGEATLPKVAERGKPGVGFAVDAPLDDAPLDDAPLESAGAGALSSTDDSRLALSVEAEEAQPPDAIAATNSNTTSERPLPPFDRIIISLTGSSQATERAQEICRASTPMPV